MTELPLNYDTRTVGRAYVRVERIAIDHPIPGGADLSAVVLDQAWAVRMHDDSIQRMRSAGRIETPLDTNDPTPRPLVDVDSGEPLPLAVREQMAAAIMAGVVTTGITMLCVLAVARSIQPPVPQGE